MSDRDCPHGHKLGKCDSCELIVVEEDNHRLRLLLVEREHILLLAIAALEECLGDALASFKTTQRPSEYSEEHWSNRAAGYLKEQGER